MTDEIKLRWLADWFDSNDTPGDGDEVQRDLRRIAGRIEALTRAIEIHRGQITQGSRADTHLWKVLEETGDE